MPPVKHSISQFPFETQIKNESYEECKWFCNRLYLLSSRDKHKFMEQWTRCAVPFCNHSAPCTNLPFQKIKILSRKIVWFGFVLKIGFSLFYFHFVSL